MGVESLKSKVQKRINQETIKKDYQEVGTFIKKRRTELNMTQDMISNGICSVSYLSKIENNQIAPNAFFIKEIMSKLDIEEDFVNKNLEDQTYLKSIIETCFYQNDMDLEELYAEIKDVEDNVTIDICKFGYIILTSQKHSLNALNNLEPLIMNMNDIELKTYLYFSALYFVEFNDYKTAFEVLMMALDIKGSNDYICALIHELSYYVKQRLLMKNSSLQHYDEAMRVYRKYFNNDRTMFLTLRMLEYLSDENPSLAYEKIEKVKVGLLSDKTRDFYYLVKGRLSFLLGRNQESAGYLSYIKEQSKWHIEKLLLLYEVCMLEEDIEMQTEIKRIIQKSKMKRSDMTKRVYYQYLNESSEEDQKLYLRDIAIPFSIKSSNYKMLLFYTDRIMEICINTSRYKEATQYYKKCNKEISSMDMVFVEL